MLAGMGTCRHDRYGYMNKMRNIDDVHVRSEAIVFAK